MAAPGDLAKDKIQRPLGTVDPSQASDPGTTEVGGQRSTPLPKVSSTTK